MRQPLYGALAESGHALMLMVRNQWMDLAKWIAPAARIEAIPFDPYQLAIEKNAEAVESLAAAAREFAPDIFLVTPYQWTLLEERLAAALPGARVVGFSGHLFAGDPKWGIKSGSTLTFQTRVEVPEEMAELKKNELLASALLDGRTNLNPPRMAPPASGIQEAEHELAQLGLEPGKYWIGWVGHSQYTEVRNWNLKSWADVLGYWAEKYAARFLLAGDETERASLAQLREMMGSRGAGVAFCKEDLSLGAVAGLIHHSRGYIGKDTGPMHLAAALGKPVIAVFGGGTWPRFQPAAEPSWAGMVRVACVGCGWQCPFETSHCIKDVPVEAVRDAIDRLEAQTLTGREIFELTPPPELYREMARQATTQVKVHTFDLAKAKREEYEQWTKDWQEQIAKLTRKNDELTAARRARNRYRWPSAAPAGAALPATLPGGRAWPKISIVTPSFNQGKYVEQTILSVINQEYPNLEYIFMDGGSTDETMSIVDRYRDRITWAVSEKDRGQSHAINKGMALASGELLTWLNSDDMLEPGALAAMAMAFATSGADMIAGVCTVHDDGEIVSRHITSCADGPLPLNDLLDLDGCWLKGQFFHQPEVMFTRDLWQRAGSHVEEKLFYSMDYELWLRFAEQGARIHSIGRSICLYRTHEQQKTFDPAKYTPELRDVRDAYLRRTGKTSVKRAYPPNLKSGLRIVFFNDMGGVAGAGIAHQRLATAAATAGAEVIPVAIRPSLATSHLTNGQIIDAIAEHRPDLVVAGNIHAAGLDPAILGLLAERWPTVQVLHDLYSLTGRCAYMGDCTKYLSGCDETCPTAYEYPALKPNLIRGAWEAKNRSLTSAKAPILAGVSAWSEQVARRRFAGGAAPGQTPEIIRIRLGLPMDLFKPRDKSTCRDLLGLPQDRFIVLFSSSHLADKRKGLDHLIEALDRCDLPDVLAVCVGELHPSLKANHFEIRSMGYVGDMHTLALVYSACDLFMGPSLLETFGQVFIEAAACGTPSVGYTSAGGVAEAIADGVSGQLTPRPCAEELAHTVQSLHADPNLRRDMAAWGRLWIENEHSSFASYQSLFSQLNRIGLIRELGTVPKITFLRESAPEPKVTYLEPGSEPAPPTVPASSVGSVVQLRSRVISLEAERDSLRTAVQHVTHTRLWRMVEATYPMYLRVINSRAVPLFVRKTVHATGQWLASRSNNTKH
ncbi:MAG TPA: glycosyltransferase [Tepidisphaeraceae bacterium]|nr:glycosyltransferase [Tepidisphaeraceae bacterium]